MITLEIDLRAALSCCTSRETRYATLNRCSGGPGVCTEDTMVSTSRRMAARKMQPSSRMSSTARPRHRQLAFSKLSLCLPGTVPAASNIRHRPVCSSRGASKREGLNDIRKQESPKFSLGLPAGVHLPLTSGPGRSAAPEGGPE
jgi:hypothetical protein